jgi:hypothetical protein
MSVIDDLWYHWVRVQEALLVTVLAPLAGCQVTRVRSHDHGDTAAVLEC